MNFLQNWFRGWSHRLDRYLFGLTFLVLALLVISQLLLTNEKARYYLNRIEFNEGVPYHWPEEALSNLGPKESGKGYWVEFELHEGSSLEILRNGEPAGLIVPAGTTVQVEPGDMLALRGDVSQPAPAVVEIIATGGLLYPQAGTRIETFGDYDLIGWVVPDD